MRFFSEAARDKQRNHLIVYKGNGMIAALKTD